MKFIHTVASNPNILDKMKNDHESLGFGEKLYGSIQITFFGILVVFIVLFILYIAINILSKLLNENKSPKTEVSKEEVKAVDEVEEKENENDEELIAVITAAIASSMNKSTCDIRVNNIKRINDPTPAWGKFGRVEQISNKLNN